MSDWLVYGVPTLSIVIAIVGILSAWIASKRFDKKHPPGRDASHDNSAAQLPLWHT